MKVQENIRKLHQQWDKKHEKCIFSVVNFKNFVHIPATSMFNGKKINFKGKGGWGGLSKCTKYTPVLLYKTLCVLEYLLDQYLTICSVVLKGYSNYKLALDRSFIRPGPASV